MIVLQFVPHSFAECRCLRQERHRLGGLGVVSERQEVGQTPHRLHDKQWRGRWACHVERSAEQLDRAGTVAASRPDLTELPQAQREDRTGTELLSEADGGGVIALGGVEVAVGKFHLGHVSQHRGFGPSVAEPARRVECFAVVLDGTNQVTAVFVYDAEVRRDSHLSCLEAGSLSSRAGVLQCEARIAEQPKVHVDDREVREGVDRVFRRPAVIRTVEDSLIRGA